MTSNCEQSHASYKPVASLHQVIVVSRLLIFHAALLNYITAQDGLRDALRYLSQSEQDYKSLGMLEPLMDVHYYQSIVYHNLGMDVERDQVAASHAMREDELKKITAIVFDRGSQNIWDMVTYIGGALTYQR